VKNGRHSGRHGPAAIGRMLAGISALVIAVLVGCAADPAPATDLIAVPTQTPGPPIDLGPQACPTALLEGMLVRHDEAGVAVHGDPNFPPSVVAWPHGWAARDVDGVRELLDADGRVVAREGDFVSAGGGAFPPHDWFYPCGDIKVTPAG
jgi:uncharacterized Zn-binding protein involved in type VI secretion